MPANGGGGGGGRYPGEAGQDSPWPDEDDFDDAECAPARGDGGGPAGLEAEDADSE